MADFSKFKVGSTSYNVKDANAARKFDQPAKGMLALKNAANQQIDYTQLKLDGSLEDVTIDPATLADGDVVTYDANTQEWVNKPASGGGGGGGVDISPIAIAFADSWPGQPTSLSAPTGNFTLSDHFAIQIQDFNQPPMPYVKSVLATGFTIDGCGSVTEFFNQHYSAGASFSIIAWFVVDMNRIVKVTADCTYDGNGEYTVSRVSATTATAVGA